MNHHGAIRLGSILRWRINMKQLQIEIDELHEIIDVYKFQLELLIGHAKWSHGEILNEIRMEHQAAVQIESPRRK